MLFKNKVERENYIRLIWLFTIVLVSLYVLFSIPGFITPILISVILGYLFNPFVNYMERKKIPRLISVSITFVVLGALVVILYDYSVGKLLTQFQSMQSDLPRIFASVIQKLKAFESKYLVHYAFLDQFRFTENIRLILIRETKHIFTSIPKLLSSLLSTALLVPFYTFFILKDGAKLKRWIFNQLPNKFFESGVQLVYNVNNEMGGFIRARLLEALIVGFLVGVGLSIVNLKYFMILSIFVAIMNLIPYVGPFIGALPGVLVAFYYHSTDAVFFFVLFLYIFAQIIDIFFIIPLVFSKIVKVHPVMVVILIIIGSHVYGIVGMILAVPVFSILKSIYDAVYERVALGRV